MKNRNCRAALVTAAALIFPLTGCGQQKTDATIILSEPDTQKTDMTELTFFGFKEGAWNVMAIEAAINGFTGLYPDADISYEGIEGVEYWDALEKRAATGHMDDIIMLDHDHVLSLSAEGLLADLSDLSTLDNYSDMAKSQFAGDGSVYFLPTCISTYGLYVNLDLLEEHGQSVPANLDELGQVCDYFVSEGITPIIGNNYSSLRCLMAATGLYPVYQMDDPEQEIARFNSGEADLAETLRPGVELVDMMLERGWFDPDEVQKTTETWGDTARFLQGDRPFLVTGGWASPTIDAGKPDFSYAVYPFPILEDGSVLVQDVNTCLAVNARGENVEEAKAFVEYLTQTDVMWEYCDNQSSFTPLRDDRLPSNAALAPSVPYLTNGRSVIGSDYNLALPIDAALLDCADALLEGADAETAWRRLKDYCNSSDLSGLLRNISNVPILCYNCRNAPYASSFP